MALPELTTENFISTIESSPIPVLVLFGAEWCAPCKRLKSILDQAVPLLAGKVSIRYVDCGVADIHENN
jgi:thioredoxin-like negative regulator of GroEL